MPVASEEGIDEEFEHVGDVVAAAGLADGADEISLVFVDVLAGVGPIPGEHLDRVAADLADLVDAPVLDGPRLAAPRRLADPVLLQGHDQPRAPRQDVDRGGNGEVRIEQH